MTDRITIVEDLVNEEKKVIFLNDVEIATITHDSIGWDGMNAVEDVVSTMAMLLNIPVEYKFSEEEEEE